MDIGQIGLDAVEQHHRDQLRERVGRHVLEDTKGGVEGHAALSDDREDAEDAGLAASKGLMFVEKSIENLEVSETLITCGLVQ